MLLSHFSGFLTAYCSCDCIEETCGFRPGMAVKRFWCARLVVLRWLWQLGRKAFLFPAHSGLSFAATSAVFRAIGKISLGHWTAFTLPGFSPSQADQFFFPTPPSHPFPHRNSLSPPQISLQLSYRQIYLSNFKNFGSKKTLGQLSWGKVGMLVLHIAVDRAHPRKVLALYIKSQSNTIH